MVISLIVARFIIINILHSLPYCIHGGRRNSGLAELNVTIIICNIICTRVGAPFHFKVCKKEQFIFHDWTAYRQSGLAKIKFWACEYFFTAD